MRNNISFSKRKPSKDHQPLLLQSKKKHITRQELYTHLITIIKHQKNQGVTKHDLYILFIEPAKKLILKILP